MTTDLDALLEAAPPPRESAVTLVPSPPRCSHRPRFNRILGADGWWSCVRCGDRWTSRKGRSSDRLGKDQERRIQRVYGPRKVGQFGTAVDHLGKDFAWQSRATRGPMPAWLAAVDAPIPRQPTAEVRDAADAMAPLSGGRYPVVIQSFVRAGVRTRDRLWVRAADWADLHGGDLGDAGWIVMSGEAWLAVHGSDAEVER